MNSKNIVSSLFLVVFIGIILVFAGMAGAQGHEGGLGGAKVPLNIASASQLEKIEGVDEDLAEAIVEYRETKGVFDAPEDLLKVPGLTKEVYAIMDPQVGSEGELFCVPEEGLEDDDEDEDDIPLSPSKC